MHQLIHILRQVTMACSTPSLKEACLIERQIVGSKKISTGQVEKMVASDLDIPNRSLESCIHGGRACCTCTSCAIPCSIGPGTAGTSHMHCGGTCMLPYVVRYLSHHSSLSSYILIFGHFTSACLIASASS